jgi:hypothetical protein
MSEGHRCWLIMSNREHRNDYRKGGGRTNAGLLSSISKSLPFDNHMCKWKDKGNTERGISYGSLELLFQVICRPDGVRSGVPRTSACVRAARIKMAPSNIRPDHRFGGGRKQTW